MLNNLLDPSRGLVRSSFSHDKVEQPVLDSGLVLHGQQRALQALRALESSRDARRQHAVSVPTWTGKSGQAGSSNHGSFDSVLGGGSSSSVSGLHAGASFSSLSSATGLASGSFDNGGPSGASTKSENAALQRLRIERAARQEKQQKFDEVNRTVDTGRVTNALEQYQQLKALREFEGGGEMSQMQASKRRMRPKENKIEQFKREHAEIQQERQQAQSSSSSAVATMSYGGGVHTADVSLARNVLAFFLNDRVCPHRSASTSQVLDHFDGQVAAHHKALFKDVLQALCTLDKPANKMLPAVWTLKDEYKNDNLALLR
ncbi:unnamed protein product [Amoebophrya sp. A25]|nr:unnamed protein product [Amoebophrya sp. A25]|eukprot:GSA25T00026373001.1